MCQSVTVKSLSCVDILKVESGLSLIRPDMTGPVKVLIAIFSIAADQREIQKYCLLILHFSDLHRTGRGL